MKLKILLLSVLCILFAGCSKTNVDPYKPYRKYTSRQIYNQGIHNLIKGHYDIASDNFEALNAIYPFGPFSEAGQLDLIYAYFKDGDQPETVAAVDRYIRLYPQSPHVSYAYYMRGVVQFTMGMTWLQRWWGSDPAERAMTNKQQAFLAFSQIARFYPHSPYASDAMVRMHYIRNMLAFKQLLTAKYYWDRGAYVASADRASSIVQHYEGTPSVIPALVMMVRSYRKLGLTRMANNSLRILSISYPGAAKAAKLA